MMKSVLTASLVSFVTVTLLVTPCFAEIDPATAVGIYLFEEDGGEAVIDHSRSGNDGTIIDGDPMRAAGRFGLAIDVGEGGWVEVESNDTLHPANAWSIVAWFNINEITGFHTIVTKWNEYLFRIDTPAEGSKLSAFVQAAGAWGPRASATVPETNTWTHGGLVWAEDGSLKIYMNGAEIAQVAKPGEVAPNDNPLCIGSQTGGWLWDGLLDDVGIFKAALSADDVNFIMENGLAIAMDLETAVEPGAGLAATWGELKVR